MPGDRDGIVRRLRSLIGAFDAPEPVHEVDQGGCGYAAGSPDAYRLELATGQLLVEDGAAHGQGSGGLCHGQQQLRVRLGHRTLRMPTAVNSGGAERVVVDVSRSTVMPQ
jgi:hypothetical protein